MGLRLSAAGPRLLHARRRTSAPGLDAFERGDANDGEADLDQHSIQSMPLESATPSPAAMAVPRKAAVIPTRMVHRMPMCCRPGRTRASQHASPARRKPPPAVKRSKETVPSASPSSCSASTRATSSRVICSMPKSAFPPARWSCAASHRAGPGRAPGRCPRWGAYAERPEQPFSNTVVVFSPSGVRGGSGEWVAAPRGRQPTDLPTWQPRPVPPGPAPSGRTSARRGRGRS